MDKPTRIVIADDHPLFRDGLKRALDSAEGFDLIAQASDGGEALRTIKEVCPDIAVLDVSMPTMDGLEVVRALQNEGLPTEVVILTMYKEMSYFNAALDLGVRGYILKDSAVSEFLACLKTVREGQYYISPAISHLLIDREKRLGELRQSIPGVKDLTRVEREILKLISMKLTSAEISDQMCVSVRTVDNHRNHIRKKLGLNGHGDLLEFALANKDLLS